MKDRALILKAVKQMPVAASFEKIMHKLDELWLTESIKHSLNRTKPSTGTPHEDMPKLLKEWLRELKEKRTFQK
ncbi:MAG: hypothetical protein ABSF34_03120 [Verrucomicrobiota bacterium]